MKNYHSRLPFYTNLCVVAHEERGDALGPNKRSREHPQPSVVSIKDHSLSGCLQLVHEIVLHGCLSPKVKDDIDEIRYRTSSQCLHDGN
jgi:hypothetical protein